MNWQGYYINLDRSPDRRQRVEREIARYGLAGRYRRFPAVDGRTLDVTSPRSKAECGIFRSHLALMDIASQSDTVTHVVEDDVFFCDLTEAAVDRAASSGVLRVLDILFTETYVPLSPRAIRFYRNMFDECTGGRWPVAGIDQVRTFELGERYLYGATSYVVSPRGARRVLEVLREEWARGPRIPVDIALQEAVRAGRLRVGCVMPFVTAIDLETAQESTADRADEVLDESLVQRLLRHSFFARRDLEGYVIPRLDAALARMKKPGTQTTMAIDRRIMEYIYLS